jgi:streptogramin lyase
VLILPHEVWVSGAGPHAVHAIDRATNRDRVTISLPGEPCAGLAAGFGSLWVPMCGSTQSIARIDLRTHRIVATIPMGPAEEGGIAVSGNGVWFTSDDAGTLLRLDPRANTVGKTIRIAAGSHNPIVDGDVLWITSINHDLVTAVDTLTGTVLATVPTGPEPRFLTAGAGAVWTLNQGDGSVTRIDARKRRAVATIALGIPGHGGDIAYAKGIVWATTIGLPLTAIDARTNQVLVQWAGPGGDSLKVDNRSIWLTDYRAGTLARIHVADALPRLNHK